MRVRATQAQEDGDFSPRSGGCGCMRVYEGCGGSVLACRCFAVWFIFLFFLSPASGREASKASQRWGTAIGGLCLPHSPTPICSTLSR